MKEPDSKPLIHIPVFLFNGGTSYPVNNESAIPKQTESLKPPKITGAGDAFALIAQPAAKLIDKVAGTDLANCLPCKKRRADWNKAFPFGKPDNQV